ncbi:MAG TPA: glycine zipper 2TM domain-containing protein, partial [Usitatibacter sp.]
RIAEASMKTTGKYLLAMAALSMISTVASAACVDCGTVVDVQTVTQKGESSGGGAVLGGVIGGVLGHQVGSGRGNTAATIVGAGAGAYAGNEVEKNKNKVTTYVVKVKLDDGNSRTFNFSQPTSYQIGDKIRIHHNKLVRQ